MPDGGDPIGRIGMGTNTLPLLVAYLSVVNGLLGQLTLEPFVAIEADLGIVGKVAAKLQDEGAEIVVEDVPIVVVDHGCRFDDPGVGALAIGAASTLGPTNPCGTVSNCRGGGGAIRVIERGPIVMRMNVPCPNVVLAKQIPFALPGCTNSARPTSEASV